jgi:hypothetical protein
MHAYWGSGNDKTLKPTGPRVTRAFATSYTSRVGGKLAMSMRLGNGKSSKVAKLILRD